MISQPTLLPIPLGAATQDAASSKVRPRLIEVQVAGSAISVQSLPTPGCQIILESPSGLAYRTAESDFIRPGFNFKKFYVRHENNDGGTLLLAVYPPQPEDDYPSLLRTQPLPKSRGIVSARLTEAAASIWRSRLQNNEPAGGRVAYVHALDIEHDQGAGTSVRIRVDMNQPLTVGAAGEAESLINWNENLSTVAQPTHLPAVRMMTKGAAWADPPAAPISSYYLTLTPENGLEFTPPMPLYPQKEIRVAFLTSPALTASMTADISGDVQPTAG